MDGIDRRIITELYEKHIEFRRLYDEHLKLHEQLSRFDNRNYLSASESEKEKQLKVKKLHGRERLLDIINQNRGSSDAESFYSEAVNG